MEKQNIKEKAENKKRDSYADIELICKKCEKKEGIQRTFEIQQGLILNQGNIRKWYKQGLKYGFVCSECRNVFSKNKEVWL